MPDAVATASPIGDLSHADAHGAVPLGNGPQQFVRDFLGGAPEAMRDRLVVVSPWTYLSAKTPPTLIVQPERDDVVPAEGNRGLIARALQAGVDATLAEIPFAYHGFGQDPDSLGGQIRNTIVENWLADKGLRP